MSQDSFIANSQTPSSQNSLNEPESAKKPIEKKQVENTAKEVIKLVDLFDDQRQETEQQIS
jgi:hypothetical protein